MEKLKLFSATHRCQPCRVLVQALKERVPNWEEKVEYVDADSTSPENKEIATKVGIRTIPALVDGDALITGWMEILRYIKDICTKE